MKVIKNLNGTYTKNFASYQGWIETQRGPKYLKYFGAPPHRPPNYI